MHSSTPGTNRMFFFCLFVALVTWTTYVDQVEATFIEGLGYREQALQQPKTAGFKSEKPGPIKSASLNGGTNIFIKSPGLNSNPIANQIYMKSPKFNNQLILAKPLNEDDAFNSNPQRGFIIYRIPAVHELLNVEPSRLDEFWDIDFYLSIKTMTDSGEIAHLQCKRDEDCRINYRRSHTPMVFYVYPQVLYYESYTQIKFQTKHTMDLIKDLKSDEMPFVNTEIDGSKLDFEYNVDSDTSMGWFGWDDAQVTGQVGEMPIGYKNDIKMLWEVGYAQVHNVEALHCSYDNKTCYNALSVPAIFNISMHKGFITGGQNLTIYGHGFGNETVKVTVAGVDCKVTQFQEQSVSCETQPVQQASSTEDVPQPGAHGLRRRFYNSSVYYLSDLDNKEKTFTESLATSFEVPENQGWKIGNVLTGWFIAPDTAKYKFHLSCNDFCVVNMGLDPSDPLKTTEIANRGRSSDFREFFTLKDEQDIASEWYDLQKGEKYYIEGRHIERHYSDHFTLGVEIQQNSMKDHHHSMKEIQYMAFYVKDPKHDMTRITVDGVDKGGFYILSFQNPNDLKLSPSESIPVKANANEFWSKVKQYYWDTFRAHIHVKLEMFDKDGASTEKADEAIKHVYTIEVMKLIAKSSVESLKVIKQSPATIEVELPSAVQLSDKPITGAFRFTCPNEGNDKASNPLTTDEITIGHWRTWEHYILSHTIYRKCLGFVDKLELWYAGKFPDESGVGFYVKFSGLNGPQTQMKLMSGVDKPLEGPELTFEQSKVMEANNNIFYETIPFEMLRTYETAPQVVVQVGDYPAVCKNLTCDFKYIETLGQVTAFTYTADSKQLEITGTELPEKADIIKFVEFADAACTISEVSATKVTCTLEQDPVCGDFIPKIVSVDGLIPTEDSVSAESITCTIDSAAPTTSLNLIGGDNITISGSNFPSKLSTSKVEIKFKDDDSTVCVPQSSTSKELTCLTAAFAKPGQDLELSISINGKEIDNSLKFTTLDKIMAGLKLIPDSANPTLKTEIKINIDPTFPVTLNKDDFSVNATSQTDPTYYRQMNVFKVDDSTKTLITMFGGAWSGQYQIMIRHNKLGLLDTKALVFDVSSTVQSVSPQTGSIYGGTLVTITGTNYGKEFTDNPVQVLTSGPRGTTHCYLKEIKATQIKCRLGETEQKAGLEGDLVVFLKTSEEAKCAPKEKCAWTFTGTIPEVTSIDTKWDETNNYWSVVVGGTGFTGTVETTELTVNDKSQTTVSLSETEAIFRVSDINGWTLSNMNVYFDVGLPKGYDTVIRGKQFTLSPKLVSLSPNVGSIGGTLIIAKLEGFGPLLDKSLGHFLYHGGSLINYETDQDICKTVSIKKYGEIECLTNPVEISSEVVIGAKSFESQEKVQCAKPDDATCKYLQVESENFPVVDSIDDSAANQIVFTGKKFYTSGYKANARYAGVNADTVTIDSETQITAIWKLGLPPSGIEETPSIWFDSDNESGERFYAKITAKTKKDLKVTSSSKGLTCSFAGGCNLEINAEGLSSLFKGATDQEVIYEVKVCEETCIFDEANSDASKVVCKLPKMSTAYSNENFKIETDKDDLRFAKTFGNPENFNLVFDDKLPTGPQVSSSASECFVGGQFKKDHIGIIKRVRYLMPEIQDKTLFVEKLKFQGSNDGKTWNDLFSADENIHEGWNYYEWEESKDYPKFSQYRLYNSDKSGCLVNELKLTGVETIDDTQPTYPCSAVIQKEQTSCMSGIDCIEVVSELPDPVTYSGEVTPLLTDISPRFGAVTGGETVTFKGTGFAEDSAQYQIIIDGIECLVKSASASEVTCETDKRGGLRKSTLEIYIDGKGLVSNQGKLFRYVQLWSDEVTWGNENIPMFNESVHIPSGMNVLVDVDSTPMLNLVLVEGSIIFAPNPDDPKHERYFDAKYIMLNDAYMEVGTEEFPYTSKLTITMHGDVSTPFIPTFGNKCIAVRQSTLDMHGVERKPTWTVMEETAEPGATTIKLAEAVDWVAGEQIAIAATSFNGREGEKRTIKSIDNSNKDKPVITLDQPLNYKHFAKIQTFGDESIDTRAEVGLLTRNVKFRGDPETSFNNQYGATIFLHSEGDDSLVARLAHIELTDVGQAFKVGRYAIHFHMIGAVHKSYCKGLGTHQGFNRAFTLHGTHYLKLMNNVVFDVKGHNIFIEDAVEKKNYIYKNLVMMAKRSWSLLNTDQTPACFWITNPDNNFIDNHCGGSDRYGYWYDLQTHAIAQHASTDVCPENERVGEFKNNHAHSCGRYGLRIFHNMVPREYPCKPIEYDVEKPDDPWHKNRPITANFYGLTSWKNGRNGAIAEKVGDVRFHDFKVADNILAGIEFSLTDDYGEDTTRINNALVIGRTENTEAALDEAEPYGIIGPRTDNFLVEDVRFYNFDWGEAAALSSCSHCFHHAATDSGGRTIRFRKLKFDSSVKRKINYQFPYRAIFLDEDGTLTGKGANSWATPYYKHHELPECEHNEKVYGGVFCDPSIQVRRVAFSAMQPKSAFFMQGMFVMRYDDAVVKEIEDLEAYAKDLNNWGEHTFKEELDPKNGWVIPFVTGHKYRIQFGKEAIDYEEMRVDASEKWRKEDKSVYLVHKWIDKREAIEIRIGSKEGELMPNKSIAESEDDWAFGQNIVYNETEMRETHFIVNGKNQPENPYQEQRMFHKGIRCVGSCVEKIEEKETEDRVRYWSVAKDWPDEKVPVEGDDVHVESGWNMVFDMNPSPKYKLIRVNGKLTFDPSKDTYLKAKHIFIRAGELHIGSKEKPYEMNAKITLYGEQREETIVYDNAIEAGNKLIANVNVMRMYGKQRWKMTRLLEPANKDSSEFMVEKELDLVKGDRLGLLPTSYAQHAIDDVIVDTYDSSSGKVTIDGSLKFYHWGKATSTANDYDGLDMRGEVILLSRNIKIEGENVEKWGCQIVTSDTQEIFDNDLITRTGSTIMDNVEIYNSSQIDTFKAALRFEGATSLYSEITNCAIHNGLSWGLRIKGSQNIYIKNNIFFQFRPIGVGVLASKNITLDDNVVAGIYERETLSSAAENNLVDKMGAYAICSYEGLDASCADIKLRNNIAAGSVFGGFLTYGHDCGDYKSQFEGNVAHSISVWSGVGLFFREHPSQKECTEFSNFKAYKCRTQGAFTNPVIKKVIMSKMTMVDNVNGVGAMINNKAWQYDLSVTSITIKDSKVYGEYGSPDCPQEGKGGFCIKTNKYGYVSGQGSYQTKVQHMKMMVDFPHHKFMGEGTWGTKVEVRGLSFIGFKEETELGKRQRIFQLNEWGSDLIPVQEFYDTTFKDCDEKALGYLMDPPSGWAVTDDCGAFPCTGPYNTLFSFKDTKFEGTQPSYASDKFQLVPDTPSFTEFVPNCNKQEEMNAWTCQQEKLGILMFESEDSDSYDRSMQPIFASLQQEKRIYSKVNSFMDHVWDGFYTGQVRLSRFPILVYAPKGAVYNIKYTGTPAKKMRYALRSQDKTLGMTVRIAYPSSESRQILKDGELVEMNKWNDEIKNPSEVKQEFCGENRYIGIQNILEFYITEGCTLHIAPRDAIQTLVRMKWTMDEFFNKGGTTKFIDRVAGSLGIHASTIKVVSVYEGSVVVIYDITPDPDEPKENQGETLANLQKKQNQLFAKGEMDLGAPILDVQVKITRSTEQSNSEEQKEPVSIIKDGEVVYEDPDEEDQGSSMIALLIVVVIILVGVIAGYFIYHHYQNKQKGLQTREEVYKTNDDFDKKSDTESAATGRKLNDNVNEHVQPSPVPSVVNGAKPQMEYYDSKPQTTGAKIELEDLNGGQQQDPQSQNENLNDEEAMELEILKKKTELMQLMKKKTEMQRQRRQTEQINIWSDESGNINDLDAAEIEENPSSEGQTGRNLINKNVDNYSVSNNNQRLKSQNSVMMTTEKADEI